MIKSILLCLLIVISGADAESKNYEVKINHLIIDFAKCTVPNTSDELEKILRNSAELIEATGLEFTFHKFQPDGVSAVLILAESHISIHYWYEEKFATVDIMSCGNTHPEKAVEYMKEAFKASECSTKFIKRPLSD